MERAYNLFIYDISLKSRQIGAKLRSKADSSLSITYTGIDKNVAMATPIIRGISILDGFSSINSVRSFYSFGPSDFKTQEVKVQLRVSTIKSIFFNYFYKLVLSDLKFQAEIYFQSRLSATNYLVLNFINVNMLLRRLGLERSSALSFLDFGETVKIVISPLNKNRNVSSVILSFFSLL